MNGEIKILYTNWRGETRWRLIVPVDVVWSEGNEWHPSPQWLLNAKDVEDEGKIKGFSLLNIHRIERSI